MIVAVLTIRVVNGCSTHQRVAPSVLRGVSSIWRLLLLAFLLVNFPRNIALLPVTLFLIVCAELLAELRFSLELRVSVLDALPELPV